MNHEKENIAFIDGQNLHLGTLQDNWKVDLKRLRIYLKDKYQIDSAYYFLSFFSKEYESLHEKLNKSGFEIIFKIHPSHIKSNKKGNIDSDLIFEVMKNIVDNTKLKKIIIISSDGGYKKLVNYLIKKDKLMKILFPSQNNRSSLYHDLDRKFIDYLNNPGVRKKISK